MHRIPHFGFVHNKPGWLTFFNVKDRWYLTSYKQGFTYFYSKSHFKHFMDYRDLDLCLPSFFNEPITVVTRHPRHKLFSGLVEDIFNPRMRQQCFPQLTQKFPFLMLHDRYYDDNLSYEGVVPTPWPEHFFDRHYDELVQFLLSLFNTMFESLVYNSQHTQMFYNMFDEFRHKLPHIRYTTLPLESVNITDFRHKLSLKHSNSQFYPAFEEVLQNSRLYPRVRDQFNSLIDSEVKYYKKLLSVVDMGSIN